MNIGIFGGSFNPIHNGHIALAKAFLRQKHLDEVWLMVSPQNPLKRNNALLDDKMRLRMVEKALGNLPKIIAYNYEFQLPKPSYTWNTLQRLSEDFPNHHFSLLIGGDNWKAFNKWYRHEDILANYSITIYPRKGDEIDKNELPSNVSLLNSQLINISSTEIRERVKIGKPIGDCVPNEIIDDVKKAYTICT